MSGAGAPAEAKDRAAAQAWRTLLAPYEGPDTGRSLRQLAVTAVLYAAGWAAMWRSFDVGLWLVLLVGLPVSGLMVRLFILQHDCGHGSYFRSQRAADITGHVLAVLAMTPYHYWRTNHAKHHAHSGNLDRRGFGDIGTLTTKEFEALGAGGRLGYRLLRNPLLLIGLLTTVHFIVVQRWPWRMPRTWRREWRSVWWTNAALAAVLAGAWWVGELGRVLVIQGVLMAWGCSFAGWLTHVQHQFEGAYWERGAEWDYFEAGLRGSSWLALPRPLQWLTASIGLHHVHHLSSRIPNYRLQQCHDENPELWSAHRITLREALRSLWLALWDEDAGRLISFGEYRRRTRTAALPVGAAADAACDHGSAEAVKQAA